MRTDTIVYSNTLTKFIPRTPVCYPAVIHSNIRALSIFENIIWSLELSECSSSRGLDAGSVEYHRGCDALPGMWVLCEDDG